MTQQTPAKPELVVWELGEYGIIKSYGPVWHGYAVGSGEEAYAELKRLEAEEGPNPNVQQ
jgi:hypothetical protein